MSPWICNVKRDKVVKELKMGMRRMGVRFSEEEGEWSLPDILSVDDPVLYGVLV